MNHLYRKSITCEHFPAILDQAYKFIYTVWTLRYVIYQLFIQELNNRHLTKAAEALVISQIDVNYSFK